MLYIGYENLKHPMENFAARKIRVANQHPKSVVSLTMKASSPALVDDRVIARAFPVPYSSSIAQYRSCNICASVFRSINLVDKCDMRLRYELTAGTRPLAWKISSDWQLCASIWRYMSPAIPGRRALSLWNFRPWILEKTRRTALLTVINSVQSSRSRRLNKRWRTPDIVCIGSTAPAWPTMFGLKIGFQKVKHRLKCCKSSFQSCIHIHKNVLYTAIPKSMGLIACKWQVWQAISTSWIIFGSASRTGCYFWTSNYLIALIIITRTAMVRDGWPRFFELFARLKYLDGVDWMITHYSHKTNSIHIGQLWLSTNSAAHPDFAPYHSLNQLPDICWEVITVLRVLIDQSDLMIDHDIAGQEVYV